MGILPNFGAWIDTGGTPGRARKESSVHMYSKYKYARNLQRRLSKTSCQKGNDASNSPIAKKKVQKCKTKHQKNTS